MEERTKMKNTVNSDILTGFWMPEHWKHCKNQYFGPTLCEQRVNYGVFDGKHGKNTVKNNVFQWFFVYVFELASDIGTWKNWRAVFSRVWGNEGIGNIVKNDVLERFYGDKFVTYRVLKENIANTCNHTSKNTGFGGWKKNADNGAKCRLDSFSGRRHRGFLKFPSLGGPHEGEKIKKHPLGGSQGGGEIVALDGSGCGRLRSFLK